MMTERSAASINWYPGHMARTKRTLSEQIRRIDLLIEVCDARLPFSSRNPEIDQLAAGKKRIVFLNKADLADPKATAEWVKTIRANFPETYAIDSTRLKSKEILGIIRKATEEIVGKALEKGIRKTVRAMVAGVPNTGKSTLINQLRGKGIARTGDRPGVTKSNQWVHITPYLDLLDTPGLLWPRLDDQAAARRLCYIGSIRDEITDQYMLAISLLEELEKLVPETVMSRFHLERASLRGAELLDAVCKGRGWLLKGNQFDYDRASKIVLDEFRAGKLGRITLEKPEKATEESFDEPRRTRKEPDGI